MRTASVLEELRAMGPFDVNIMEVCGTHTMAIARSGLRQMLPPGIRLLSGPGCPVCVTPPEAIDAFLELTADPRILLATYGDMIRVPGSSRGDSLRRRMALGARVEVVFSPVDALSLARENPDKEVVFLGVGFETTAPGTAAAIKLAAEQQLRNFSVFPLLRRVEPALRALVRDPDFAVQGFLCPGHVAVILGEEGFRFLPEELGLPGVIAGFAPENILESILLLCRQLREGQPRLENHYPEAVSPEGNPLARAMMEEVFAPSEELWRGLGRIPDSGFRLRERYRDYDALSRFGISLPRESRPTACRCGEVISGRLSPADCPLFGRTCTPEDPLGPCMVSSEGACAAAYRYQTL